MKLSIELDIEVDVTDTDDEGDELTAPYSATRIDYDTEAVLKQVETKLRQELHYTRTERRPEPMSPAEWMRKNWGEEIGYEMGYYMKLYAQHYNTFR